MNEMVSWFIYKEAVKEKNKLNFHFYQCVCKMP